MLDKFINIKKYNINLIIFVIIAISFGILAVNSANSTFTKKHLIGAAIAIFIMFFVACIDYRKYLNYEWFLYIINLILLISVKLPFISHSANGATRWIKVLGIQVQPSELSKVILILFVAAYIYKRQENFNTFKNLALLAILLALPLALVVTQPDLSTTVLTFLVLLGVIFIGGLSLKLILTAVAILIPTGIAFIWYIQQPWQKLLQPWQQRRVLSFIHPSEYLMTESYQQYNATLAIGSGKLYGNGLNNNLVSSVKNGNYLPEPQTDFIFAIIGEDLGFIGTVFTILILLIIILILLRIASKVTDAFAKLIVIGVACYVAFQTFINIGVVTMLLPNTGLPLPFISYGLTSLIVTCIMMGIVLNISKQIKEGYSIGEI